MRLGHTKETLPSVTSLLSLNLFLALVTLESSTYLHLTRGLFLIEFPMVEEWVIPAPILAIEEHPTRPEQLGCIRTQRTGTCQS